MRIQFDYYYSREAEQFTFYRIPKALFTDDAFVNLSVEAKVLYGLMLDRMGLSLRSGWLDDQGRVYIYFTLEDIQEQLRCGHNKAIRLLKELDQELGLIQRKRQGLGRPDRIYVMNFTSQNKAQTSDFGNSVDEEKEEFEDAPPVKAELQDSQNGNSEGQTSHFETSAVPEMGVLDLPKPDANKTEYNKTYKNETDPIHPIDPTESVEQMMDKMDRAKELLKEKWGYAALVDSLTPNKVDGVISLGADILCSQSPTIRIGKQDLPREMVAQRLLSLNSRHIKYVFACMEKTETTIRNMRAYQLTALYNAPTTSDSYYAHELARDKPLETKEFSPNNRFLQFYQSLKGVTQ
jgi:hypothetical protein